MLYWYLLVVGLVGGLLLHLGYSSKPVSGRFVAWGMVCLALSACVLCYYAFFPL